MKEYTTPERIFKIEKTTDTLTGRGGLALFTRYLSEIGIYEILTQMFGNLRKSCKGLAIWKLFKQVLIFFFDGTCRHLSYFDQLKKDAGYAAAIEECQEEMASSHSVKRFFKLFSWLAGGTFRKILLYLFLWRLRRERPKVIEMTLDTMVMDNDDAQKREGVQPTYKKKKGFQPLQMIWKGKIVDAIFRGGKKHSNFGNTVINMVRGLVQSIRKHYRSDVTIILRVDSGFFDEVNFEAFDELGICFIATGKMYECVKEQVRPVPESLWGSYDNGHQKWEFFEFGYRAKSWKRFWRAIYTRPVYDGKQQLLEFARPENVILTNCGLNSELFKNLPQNQQNNWLKPESLIVSHHGRGADELPHRGVKDFGFEQLPFKRFAPNSAFYYCMLIAFFLFETFKEDVLCEVIPITSYATTVRRKFVDFAAKIVRTSKRIILKVPKAVMEALKLDILFERCQNPPPIRI